MDSTACSARQMHRGLLAGVHVLEVGGGVAGSAAAAILASLGATVRKVAGSARTARWGPTVEVDGRRVAAIDATLDHAKQFSDDDPAAEARRADIVLVDHDGTPVPLGDVPGVLVSITPFGLDGPHADRPGGEVVAQAVGGLLGTIESETGIPVIAPGYVALHSAGAVAALAALHGLDRHRNTDEPVQVDVSVQEAVIFTAALPECAHVIFDCPGRAGSGRYVAPSGLFPCRDGMVRITAVENHQWAHMVPLLGSPEWTDGLADRPARAEHAAMITERVSEWTSTQDKAACADLLQRHGVPSSPLNSPEELLGSPQLAHRGSLVPVGIGGRPATVLGPPWRIDAGEAGSRRRAGRLDELRIAELTHVLAGPIVGALLGAMGASVVRAEDPNRLDIYRRSGPFAKGVAGVERGAYYAVANHSKASLLLDADSPSEQVEHLVSACDVVIENVGTSRLDRLGVSPPALASAGRLAVRISGLGATDRRPATEPTPTTSRPTAASRR